MDAPKATRIYKEQRRTADRMFDWYQNHQEELFPLYEGMFLVIDNKSVRAAFDFRHDAYRYASDKCRPGCYCIVECKPLNFRFVDVNAPVPPAVLEARSFTPQHRLLDEWYSKHFEALMPKYGGLFVVIHNFEVVASFDDDDDAKEYALSNCVPGSFIIRECIEHE